MDPSFNFDSVYIQYLPTPVFAAQILTGPLWPGERNLRSVNLYAPPSDPVDVLLWSDAHLYGVVAAPLVARTILPNGRRTGPLYRAGTFVVAFRRSLVPELGVALARGEWICLDTGASGQNL
jgi:hypothetical protein